MPFRLLRIVFYQTERSRNLYEEMKEQYPVSTGGGLSLPTSVPMRVLLRKGGAQQLRTALMILKISSLIIFRVNVVKYVIRIEIFTKKSHCFHSRTFLDTLQLTGAYRCVIFERKYHVKLHQNMNTVSERHTSGGG